MSLRQLGRLALVSRSFLQRSRYNQFKTLEIGDSDKVSTLFPLVRSPLATFKPHVTKIVLRGLSIFPENEFMAFFAALPNVQSVALAGYANIPNVDYLPKILQQIECLENLELSIFRVSSFTILSKIICASSKPETLQLNYVIFPIDAIFQSDSELLQGIQPPPANLRTLKIGDSYLSGYDILYRWLNSGSKSLKLSTIHLLSCYTNYPQSTAALLQSLGPSLEHLCVETTHSPFSVHGG